MKKLYLLVTATFIFLILPSTSFTQNNNLAAGDIAIVSYQSDLDLTNTSLGGTTDFDDRFSIVILRSGGIAAGTVIYFTDRGWDGPNVTWLDNGTVGHEAVIKWVVPAGGITQGTEVFFIATFNTGTSIYTWGAYTTETGTILLGTVTSETNPATDGGGMGFTVSGDEVLVYQTGPTAGPAGVYSATPIRFITALLANLVASSTTSAGWDAVPVTLNESTLPPGLTNGITAFVMSPASLPAAAPINGVNEPDNGKYNCTNSNAVACTALALSTSIYTITNWTYSNTAFAIGATTSHCTYAINASPAITSDPSVSNACFGLPVLFTAAASNASTYSWQEDDNAGFSSPATLGNTGVYSNTGTVTLYISDNSILNGNYYRIIATNGCSSATSNGALLTATTPVLPSGSTLETHLVGTSNNLSYGTSCGIISKVVPLAGTPVSGNVTSNVWVEGAVPTFGGQPYVQRHYQVTPTAGSTATITLYFSQAEFDNFNAAPGSTLDLPVNAADIANNKANLLITKFNGSSGDGTGLPGSYSSGSSIINPPDANIIFNGTFSRWEVTFDVSGFSGFFVQTAQFVLPVNLISFSAQRADNDIRLKWRTAGETENDHFELERSFDENTFTVLGRLAGINGTDVKNYDWVDAGAALLSVSKIYYRLKTISITGSVEYSSIIVVSLVKNNILVTGVTPNPFRDRLNVNLNLPRNGQLAMKLTDIAGRILLREYVQAPKGFSTNSIPGMEKLTAGMYFLSIEFEGQLFTYKVKK